ncbi:MAG: hypothetical protein LBT19_01325 [Candidatus Nomurabacteria bacterium]|jgi:uncharacterized HAD superfamily protein|nr:hypothetical protein [Candidatus Nomurabacteria bacterium]
MKKQLLAVDIDNVLADFNEAFIEYANKNWGSNLVIEDCTEDWSRLFNIDQAEWQRRATELFSEKSQIYYHLPIVSGAQAGLTKLKSHFDIIAITSRSRATNDATHAWLNDNLPGLIDEVHFSGIYDDFQQGIESHKATKGKICKDLSINFFIDDEPKHCLATADHEISTIIFGDYPSNRNFNDPRIPRAKTWREVTEILIKEQL